MVDTWQPTATILEIPVQKLSDFASLINDYEQAKSDLKQLSESDIQLVESFKNAPKEAWLKAIEGVPAEKIKDLCVFFTVGEMEFPSWSFASNNPAIFFIKYLKSTNNSLEKDFIRWLKKQTDNRYIPYGSAL